MNASEFLPHKFKVKSHWILRCIVCFLFIALGVCKSFCRSYQDTLLPILTTFVFFESAEHELDHEDSSIIKRLFDSLPTLKNKSYMVYGHTDNVGTYHYNQDLSEIRALSVRNYLLTLGAPTKDILQQAFGYSKPFGNNNTEKGRQQNRRVEVGVGKKFPLIQISGLVSGANRGTSRLVFHNNIFDKTIFTDDEGKFSIDLPEKVPIDVYINKQGHIGQTIKLIPERNSTLNIALRSIEINSIVSLRNLNFYGNKAIVLPESEVIFDHLLYQIKMAGDMCFQIEGHVNAPGEDMTRYVKNYYDLSEARVACIYTRLLENGVDEKRMSGMGYGQSKMIFPEAKLPSEQAANRRVEIRFKDCKEIKEQKKKAGRNTWRKWLATDYFKSGYIPVDDN